MTLEYGKSGETLTVSEAAQRLGTTLGFVYQELWAHRLPGAFKVGKTWRIPLAAIEDRIKVRAGSGK